jgi:hypothetical protein
MAGADEGYFPRPEKRNPVFGNGAAGTPYFEQDGQPFEGAADAPRQLQLEDDVRLPWLEGEDDDLDEESGGLSQGVVLGLLGLAALVLIAGAVFWVIQGRPEQPLVADGGVITAPKEPYKVKPKDPGGEVVAGTGDTSFAVAEGQSRPVQIDKGDDTPPPPAASGSAAARPEAKPSATAPAAPVGGVGVQIGAYATQAQAEAGWLTLKGQYEGLAAVSHRIVQGKADIGTVYRLQAVPGDAAAARTLCSGMKAAGMSCQVKN